MFELGDSEIGQVHKSVVRAFATDPALKRYYVALPYDRPAGDISGTKSGRSGTKPRKSAFTKWTEKKAEWEGLAAARGSPDPRPPPRRCVYRRLPGTTFSCGTANIPNG